MTTPAARHLAHVLQVTSAVPIDPSRVWAGGSRTIGYAVSGLSRDAALQVAGAILNAFRTDLESGEPTVRVCSGWRSTPGFTVRVTVA